MMGVVFFPTSITATYRYGSVCSFWPIETLLPVLTVLRELLDTPDAGVTYLLDHLENAIRDISLSFYDFFMTMTVFT